MDAETEGGSPSGRLVGWTACGTLLGLFLAITGRDPWTAAKTYDRLPKWLRVVIGLGLVSLLFLGMTWVLIWAGNQ